MDFKILTIHGTSKSTRPVVSLEKLRSRGKRRRRGRRCWWWRLRRVARPRPLGRLTTKMRIQQQCNGSNDATTSGSGQILLVSRSSVSFHPEFWMIMSDYDTLSSWRSTTWATSWVALASTLKDMAFQLETDPPLLKSSGDFTAGSPLWPGPIALGRCFWCVLVDLCEVRWSDFQRLSWSATS